MQGDSCTAMSEDWKRHEIGLWLITQPQPCHQAPQSAQTTGEDDEPNGLHAAYRPRRGGRYVARYSMYSMRNAAGTVPARIRTQARTHTNLT